LEIEKKSNFFLVIKKTIVVLPSVYKNKKTFFKVDQRLKEKINDFFLGELKKVITFAPASKSSY